MSSHLLWYQSGGIAALASINSNQLEGHTGSVVPSVELASGRHAPPDIAHQGLTALTDPRGVDHPPSAGRRPARGGPDRLGDLKSLLKAKPSPNFPANEGSPHKFLVSTGSCEGKQTKNHWLAGATLTMYELNDLKETPHEREMEVSDGEADQPNALDNQPDDFGASLGFQ